MINYPNKKTTYQTTTQSYSNRGMSLENIINESNEYYLTHHIAIIHKKPIPIQIVKVNYPNRQSAVITEAYYKVPSTTDYNGVYKGYHIDFEAKETQNKTSFPLQNIHKHQIEHLYNIHKQGGISFVIIYFRKTDEVFVLESTKLYEYYLRSQNGRKSITYKELKENGFIILEKLAPRLDYLKIVDILIEKYNKSL